jgi:hypothetical protein
MFEYIARQSYETLKIVSFLDIVSMARIIFIEFENDSVEKCQAI